MLLNDSVNDDDADVMKNDVMDPDGGDTYRQYLELLLPASAPHLIHSLHFGVDLQHWQASLSAELRTEEECIKWLADFGDKTGTEWIPDEAPLVPPSTVGGHIYKCAAGGAKQCPARIDMSVRIVRDPAGSPDPDPACSIKIIFDHNHRLGTPSADKQNEVSRITETSSAAGSAVHACSLTTTSSSIQSPPSIMVFGSNHSNDCLNLDDLGKRLDEVHEVLSVMLKKGGTASTAVKRFVDNVDRLKTDQDALETALTTFGLGIRTVSNSSGGAGPVSVTVVSAAPIMATPQWTMTPLAPIGDLVLPTSESREVIGSKKQSKPTKRTKDHNRIQPGQVDPLTGKRRKRSRCGTCQGCINRDQTEDCRECRNCLDQKRYGGPGKLKKACIKRSCVIMATPEGSRSPSKSKTNQGDEMGPSPVQTTSWSSSTTATTKTTSTFPVTLPMHPLPMTDVSLDAAAANHHAWKTESQPTKRFLVEDVAIGALASQSTSSRPPSPFHLEAIAAEAARHHGIA